MHLAHIVWLVYSPFTGFSPLKFPPNFASVSGLRNHQKQFQMLQFSKFSWGSVPPDPPSLTVCHSFPSLPNNPENTTIVFTPS